MLDLGLRKPGRHPTCACGECHKCRHRMVALSWYQRMTLEERRAYMARRPSKPDHRPGESANRSRKRYPERHRARVAVHNAVKRGHIEKLACFCGVVRVEAHHPDYSKPLEVVWLCRTHHVDRHKSLTR